MCLSGPAARQRTAALQRRVRCRLLLSRIEGGIGGSGGGSGWLRQAPRAPKTAAAAALSNHVDTPRCDTTEAGQPVCPGQDGARSLPQGRGKVFVRQRRLAVPAIPHQLVFQEGAGEGAHAPCALGGGFQLNCFWATPRALRVVKGTVEQKEVLGPLDKRGRLDAGQNDACDLTLVAILGSAC